MATLTEHKLTTNDNPFNPFTDFDNWFMFDIEKGYDCCSKLDRLSTFTDSMSEQECNNETERAIDALVSLDFTDTYKKVSRNYEIKDE